MEAGDFLIAEGETQGKYFLRETLLRKKTATFPGVSIFEVLRHGLVAAFREFSPLSVACGVTDRSEVLQQSLRHAAMLRFAVRWLHVSVRALLELLLTSLLA